MGSEEKLKYLNVRLFVKSMADGILVVSKSLYIALQAQLDQRLGGYGIHLLATGGYGRNLHGFIVVKGLSSIK